LTDYAARKTALCQAIRSHLRQMAAEPEPVEAAASLLAGHIRTLGVLRDELAELRDEWMALWLERARRSQIQIALEYFDSLASRLEAAAAWLAEQRRVVLSGDRVDAELAGYEGGDHRVAWQIWPD
jgi:predicted membrane chloride channel (bestrophin family)